MFRFLLVVLLLAGGCRRHAERGHDASVDIGRAAQEAQGMVNAYADTVTANAALAPRAVATAFAPPMPAARAEDRTPIAQTPFAPDSAQGAASVVQRYYALIGTGDYAVARGLWEQDAAGAGVSEATFARQFARYSSYRAHVGAPGAIDAGAGQRYVSVPIEIVARPTGSGQSVVVTGSATLHRTGDVDGATTEQRRWRLRSIETRAKPPAER